MIESKAMRPFYQRICTLALLGVLTALACTRRERATVQPWEPIDKSFTGCAGG